MLTSVYSLRRRNASLASRHNNLIAWLQLLVLLQFFPVNDFLVVEIVLLAASYENDLLLVGELPESARGNDRFENRNGTQQRIRTAPADLSRDEIFPAVHLHDRN